MAIERYVILPGFLSLETDEATKNARRPEQAIQREIHHLTSFIHDWSAWDETYDFVVTNNPEYVESNIPYSTFQDNTLNMIYFSDTKGQIIWKGAYDLKTKEAIEISEMPVFFHEGHPLTSFQTSHKALKDVKISGIYMTEKFPLLVASRPVLNNDNKGPIRGTVIMGRFLTPDILQNLIRQTEVSFKVIPVNQFTDKSIVQRLQSDKKNYIEVVNDNTLYAYALIRDITEKPALVIKSTIDRKIARKGFETLRYTLISNILLGICLLISFTIILHITIIKPVLFITKHTLSVGSTGNLYSRLNMQRKDEIGAFANRLDTMLEQLADARNRLLEQSYYSGLAGMASDIIHNTGNILTPVTIKINLLLEKLRAVPFVNMNRAITDLNCGNYEKDREEGLKKYLNLTFSELEATVKDTDNELSFIAGQMSEIESLLIGLDEYSHTSQMCEPVSIEAMFTDALSLMPSELKNSIKISIADSIKALPTLMAERIVIVQILSTITNYSAKKAFMAHKNNAELTIDAHIKSEESVTMIDITVSDNGPELESEELTGIFARDPSFSISNSVSGLHWCSNSISAMNGKIYVENINENSGTVFHIVLPLGGCNG